MATILLSAAGAALGSSAGGTLLGLSMTAVGRFAGATLGRAIDQRVMGAGADAVEGPRVERFRLTGSGEGAAIGRVYGRTRVGGHLIWASQFVEAISESGGGKGGPPKPKTRSFSYSVNLAIALCEGEIAHVARVWADGVEVAKRDLNMRVYTGASDQMPDPKMEAIEGAGMVPAYRGTAYVVFEDLALEQFGNRIPQFSFEICRPEQANEKLDGTAPSHAITGVALVPGTGEYSLATEPVRFDFGQGKSTLTNVNSAAGITDLKSSVDMLVQEAPNCQATSLVVSWFGSDLRCGSCEIKPKVEQKQVDGVEMPWTAGGIARAQAEEIAQVDSRPVYGGTPADAAVVQAIQHLKDTGQNVMFYPFILMEQLAENGLPDPWTGATGQPELPWRGRITLSAAPGQVGSPDGTSAADSEVATFFGTAQPSDFEVSGGNVFYTGPAEWSYRRFILHYAALCVAAGGVESFCIGSEMRGLTQIRGAAGFAAVQQLVQLAADARALLGAETKIGYAADWSEYFGYQPQDGSGDRYFHLDPLWADGNIDFVGIDNYMPLSDWRDEKDHSDAVWESIYDLDYLKSNIQGGEGFDWYYHSSEARAAQIRTPITDEAHDEPWVWRYKDIRNWWQNTHHERVSGIRSEVPTAWVPGSKPIWFTEIGCAAVDKGTNQPNKFLDPKSSESSLPHFSDGGRDELMQAQYLRAMFDYWGDVQNNPAALEYEGRMVDMSRCFVWAWDARPYPWFPGNQDLWSDGANYASGHWINGRISGQSLAAVVTEICQRAGLVHFDVSRLHGFVRGYDIATVDDARGALQTLMLRFAFDAIERDGLLVFAMRAKAKEHVLDPAFLVTSDELDGVIERARGSEAELAGRVRVRFVQADANFDVLAEEAVLPEDETHSVASTELPIVMTRAEGHEVAERWLAEARVARESCRIALPPSKVRVGPGDRINLSGDKTWYRVDRVEQGAAQILEAVRIEPEVYEPAPYRDDGVNLSDFATASPVYPLFLDLPLITGDEIPHAPHLAITADPWPGTVAVYESGVDADYALAQIIAARSVVGVTEAPLQAACVGMIDRGEALQIRLASGSLQSISQEQLLSGGNLMAIGDGSAGNWELFQFRDATLLAPDVWMISHRLRGQAGSDGVMPDVWPTGSQVVLLNAVPEQINLSSNNRRVARHFRIGPARRGYDDPSYVHRTEAFDGNGLRPYRPAHLRVHAASSGTEFAWVRRTRIGGDTWNSPEVPLGEESESYLIRIALGAQIVREEISNTSVWTYSAAMRATDGVTGAYQVRVAQLSAAYGAGPFATLDIEG